MKHDRWKYCEPPPPEAVLDSLQKESQKRFDASYKAGFGRQSRMPLRDKLNKLGITEEEAQWALSFFGPSGSILNVINYDDGGLERVDPRGWYR